MAHLPAVRCQPAWPVNAPVEFAGGNPHPFAGADLEHPGALEAAFAARAPAGELIFLSVGDTRDHRRQHKDPALRTISTDFLLTLLANLHRLGLENYLILTTKKLCHKLQREHCLYSCAWTSLWDDHAGLKPWGLEKGDMFLMWAQQWRYITSALERNYHVLRADTDVYFAEDPYPILQGPLLRPFAMVVQQDFGGPLGGRPKCTSARQSPSHRAASSGALTICGIHRGTALLNIGLLYARSQPGGGAFAVLNGTWARFLKLLGGPPFRPAHLRGAVETQALIDQPLMRTMVDELAVAEPALGKGTRQWLVVPGSAAPVYVEGRTCALLSDRACAEVAVTRRLADFAYQVVEPARPHAGVSVAEKVALAPDWFFGRGCLTHVRSPQALLEAVRPRASKSAMCEMPPTGERQAMPAPASAKGILVATHFVYSMALKRKRTFQAFAWDSSRSNRTEYSAGTCWARSKKGILFGHTFFTQMENKVILCAMPGTDTAECSCCAGLSSLRKVQQAALKAETTSGREQGSRHVPQLEGCDDYQAFWDRR